MCSCVLVCDGCVDGVFDVYASVLMMCYGCVRVCVECVTGALILCNGCVNDVCMIFLGCG